MMLKLKKKTPYATAVKVEGRHLAPMMYDFDNLDEVEKLLAQACVSFEDVAVDFRTGVISIPRVGSVSISQYLVENGYGNVKVFDTFDSLQEEYSVEY